ncbi:MAG: hypothetical protein HY908_30555 [Myxococcales bacterium]|nr:hypothetical protein [Myxococcales bacterium]
MRSRSTACPGHFAGARHRAARVVGAAAVALVAVGVAPARAEAQEPPVPVPAPAPVPAAATPQAAPLSGASYDYEYDGADVGLPEHAWSGRAFVHEEVAREPGRPVPLVVFLHGLNESLVRYRWMGGGEEGDLRRIVSGLIETGRIEPMLVAAPSSVVPGAVSFALFAWPGFDLDNFVALTAERLRGVATIDTSRIVVVGHSGGGCNIKGGLASSLAARNTPYAAFAVDTCMGTDLAQALVQAPPTTRTYVVWQEQGWRDRPFEMFLGAFRYTLATTSLPAGTVRELDRMDLELPQPHAAVVQHTLEKYLPRLFPSSGSAAPGARPRVPTLAAAAGPPPVVATPEPVAHPSSPGDEPGR